MNTNFKGILKPYSEIKSRAERDQPLFFGRIVEYKSTISENLLGAYHHFRGNGQWFEEQKGYYKEQATQELIEIFGVDGIFHNEPKVQVLGEMIVTSSTFKARIANCAVISTDDLWQIYKEILKFYVFKNIATVDEVIEISNSSNEYELEEETKVHLKNVISATKSLDKVEHPATVTNESLVTRITISDLGYNWTKDCATKVYFNKDILLADPAMPSWNSFHLVANNNRDLDKVVAILTKVVAIFTKQENKEKQRLILQFVSFCLNSSDARTEEGQQAMLKRIADIADILEGYILMWQVDGPNYNERQKIIEVIEGIIEKILRAGNSFPDDAIYYLGEIEIALKSLQLLREPKYFPNILINLFKRSIIQSIVGEGPEKNAMYLTYALKFNKEMGLGLLDKTMVYPIEKTVFHQNQCNVLPFEKSVQTINAKFTEENLIEFTIALPEFEEYMMQFEAEIKQFDKSLDAQADNLLCQMDDNENDQLDIKLNELFEAKRYWKDNFYKQKAVQLYLDAGFMVSDKK